MVSLWAVIIPGITAFLGVLIPQIISRKKTSAETHKVEAEAQAIEMETVLKQNEVIRRLDAIEKQVTNSHSTNMRDDLDSIKSDMRNLIYLYRQEAQIRHEHGERIKDLTEDFARFSTMIERRMKQLQATSEYVH
ncbi:hypothetical protein HMPREF0388_1745 [Mobiluncus curtisii ATCC 51333]|uniref:Uncharacterized protein n=1 Tax=Mobiluncus curtisii ATCC 51333 TaxID=887326 RepID=E6M112_9ACTO|nr:hypothetical protein HMPREF0388_1745 [Mobiluncus curtisii ATCC 51333]